MDIEEFKTLHLKLVRAMYYSLGRIKPQFTVLIKTGENEYSTHVGLFDRVMFRPDNKQDLIDKVIPQFISEAKKEGEVIAISLTAEATQKTYKAGSSIPEKKDILYVTFETADAEEVLVYEVGNIGDQRFMSDEPLTSNDAEGGMIGFFPKKKSNE